MGLSNGVLDVVVDVLLDPEREDDSSMLQIFEDFVCALCADSGLRQQEVQSRLVERMLLDPRHISERRNVVQLDDYLHLLRVN